MSLIDPLERVWPVSVKQFLMWHGIDEPLVNQMLVANDLVGLGLRRALGGHRNELRTTSVQQEKLFALDEKNAMELVLGSENAWPQLREFIAKNQKRLLSPLMF